MLDSLVGFFINDVAVNQGISRDIESVHEEVGNIERDDENDLKQG